MWVNDYLERILTAQVYDVAVETPLEPAPVLSQRLANQLPCCGLGGYLAKSFN